MPKLNFELPSPSDSATTYGKIKTFLTGENDFKKYDNKVSCSFDEPSKKCHIKGSQFTANLKVADSKDKGSIVTIDVEIPFALSLFKGKIKEILEKNFKRII
jgi:hypothetical protein